MSSPSISSRHEGAIALATILAVLFTAAAFVVGTAGATVLLEVAFGLLAVVGAIGLCRCVRWLFIR